MPSKLVLRVAVLTVILFSGVFAFGQQSNQNPTPPSGAQATPPQQVPVIDGGLGPCSVEITVKRPGGKVVDGAKVSVHIAYGFLGVRRLDLEVPTNNEGKARITGLPNNLKHGLLFHGEKDNMLGTAFVDPSRTCEAKNELVLVQRAAPDDTQSPADDKTSNDDKSSGSKDSQSKDAPQ